MTPEERKIYNKTYYKTHKEEIKAQHKTYYKTHEKKIKAQNKAYYEAHKEGLIPDSKLSYLLSNKETDEIAEVPIKELCEMLGKNYDYVRHTMKIATEVLGCYIVEE